MSEENIHDKILSNQKTILEAIRLILESQKELAKNFNEQVLLILEFMKEGFLK